MGRRARDDLVPCDRTHERDASGGPPALEFRLVGSPAHDGPAGVDPASGQGLVEFAIILPVFAFVVFGIIQGGFAFSTANGLSQAAREAARYASTLPTATSLISVAAFR